jgi:dihydropteroate synthase
LDLAAATRVMGILNVTPDSFADGASYASPADAVEAALRMEADGAEIIDVGGESTRPGASPVEAAEELRRVLPVIEGIRRRSKVRLSIDTTKGEVARAALGAGVDLVNDVSALSDGAMVPPFATHACRSSSCTGGGREPCRTTSCTDLIHEVEQFLRQIVERAVAAGILGDKILVDPGLGFGKSAAGNLSILHELARFHGVGRPLVIGASRKSFIGTTLDLPVSDRLEGSLAVAAYAAWNGAHVIRTHDVRETKRVTRMIDAIRRA